MAAYVIVLVEITDRDRFGEYLKETPRVMEKFGGRYVARAGETVVLEGEAGGARVVLMEFPSIEKAKEWYASEEYREIRSLREGAATGTIIAVQGC